MHIREVRLSKNMTQEDLAKRVGVSRTTVTMWEANECAPRASMIPVIADALSCSIDALFGRDTA